MGIEPYDCYDLIEPEFIKVTEHTARKQHIDYETGRIIKPGDRYVKVTGKWDGSVMSYKFLPEVWNLVSRFRTVFGDLKSFLDEEEKYNPGSTQQYRYIFSNDS